MRGHAIVRAEGGVVAAEVEHGVQETRHARAVLQRKTLEVVEGGEHLAQRGGELEVVAGAEHGSGGLEAVGGEETGGGEVGEDVRLVDAELGEHSLDVGVIFPETAGAVLEGLARGGEARRGARGVGNAVEEGHVASSLAERLGGAETAPAGAHHRHPGLVAGDDVIGRGGRLGGRGRGRGGADDDARARGDAAASVREARREKRGGRDEGRHGRRRARRGVLRSRRRAKRDAG